MCCVILCNPVFYCPNRGMTIFPGSLPILRFGKVEDAVVMYDKKTGRSRGFGFITYDNPDVVRKVS